MQNSKYIYVSQVWVNRHEQSSALSSLSENVAVSEADHTFGETEHQVRQIGELISEWWGENHHS